MGLGVGGVGGALQGFTLNVTLLHVSKSAVRAVAMRVTPTGVLHMIPILFWGQMRLLRPLQQPSHHTLTHRQGRTPGGLLM